MPLTNYSFTGPRLTLTFDLLIPKVDRVIPLLRAPLVPICIEIEFAFKILCSHVWLQRTDGRTSNARTQWVISFFWICLSLRLSPVLNWTETKDQLKVKSFFFVWSQRLAERLAETKLRTERSLNSKLINSTVDFAYTR